MMMKDEAQDTADAERRTYAWDQAAGLRAGINTRLVWKSAAPGADNQVCRKRGPPS